MKPTLMCMLCIHGLAHGEILEYGNTQPQSWAEQYDQLGLIHSDATHPLLQEFWYLAGHRLKWMTGMEYATLGDEHVLTASTMVRFYFGPHSGGPFPMNRRLDGHFFQPN